MVFWLEQLLAEQEGLGSLPARSKLFFSPQVQGDKEKLRTWLPKIAQRHLTQIEIRNSKMATLTNIPPRCLDFLTTI